MPVDERVEDEAVAAVAERRRRRRRGAGDAAGDDNVFGVPAHLLERAKAARARREAL